MLNPTLNAATLAFAQKLRESEPIAVLRLAKARLDADQAAQELLGRLAKHQRMLALKQQMGPRAQNEIDDLRRLQRQAQDNPTIGAYIQAQQQAQSFLPTVNAAISELLGFDFGALVRAAGR
jgi:cell fate (sporulation/competence/biofilm development) regulator YlbF (YheA/YmcA/DUF963 family)